MFKKLFRKLNQDPVRQRDEYNIELSENIEETKETLDKIIAESDDVIVREFNIARKRKAVMYVLDSLADMQALEQNIIRPLMYYREELPSIKNEDAFIDALLEDTIMFNEVETADNLDEAILGFMSGQALLAIDGVQTFVIIDARQFEQRGLEEPPSEMLVRGPRDGFNEVLHTNIGLIRRRVRDPNFVLQFGQIGRRSKRDFAIMYIKGIADPKLVDEVRYRVSCIDTDDTEESGNIEQLIEDNVMSPFPQVLRSERPDKTVSSLMNGGVAISLDGTPFTILTPITLQFLFKSPEDNYDRWQIGTLIRLLRYVAAFIALFLPAIYIAMVSFHQGMIPTLLALSISGTREGVPFPSFIEAFAMEFTLELLREAGVRLPTPIGQTIGIVGGLVIGDAAVRAGVVSPIMIIVVALTAISSFAIPSYNVSITFRMLRFGLMILAAGFGLYGIVIGFIFITVHLASLKSFGNYYMSPFAPFRLRDWGDLLFRAPLSGHKKRPQVPNTYDDQKSNWTK
ncbi:spore germination protein [Alteribacter natronophilus]|uniref:spore germination protein n=1 Tax=Alteribacter natronophilus TaxID=2583810 RepID=UPI00110D31B5|nr:spore germination protein [Alteribacter natronophilus]TMW73993.1 spore germination protein [Alteribacter natronophilus]